MLAPGRRTRRPIARGARPIERLLTLRLLGQGLRGVAEEYGEQPPMSGDAPPFEAADDLVHAAPPAGLAAKLGGLFDARAPFPLPAMEILWLLLLGALGAVAAVHVAIHPNATITEYFLLRQDLGVLVLLT